MSKPIGVIIPVYGEKELTYSVLGDIFKENLCKVYLIDNKKEAGIEWLHKDSIKVITPNRNLGWLAGTNMGLSVASHTEDHLFYVCLNNDVRLSPNFFEGLLTFFVKDNPDKLGLFSAVYCGSHEIMYPRNKYQGDADKYLGNTSFRKVPFLDGTALCVPQSIFKEFGGLEDRFSVSLGWGADVEMCIRVRDKGYNCYVTERSYLYHLIAQTAQKVIPGYFEKAATGQDKIFRELYGDNYTEKINSMIYSFDT